MVSVQGMTIGCIHSVLIYLQGSCYVIHDTPAMTCLCRHVEYVVFSVIVAEWCAELSRCRVTESRSQMADNLRITLLILDLCWNAQQIPAQCMIATCRPLWYSLEMTLLCIFMP
jgi:hypothetical protein